MTVKKAYEWALANFRGANISDAETDARLLLEYVCNADRNLLYVHGDEELSEELRERYIEVVNIRKKHVPLQHITGKWDFMGMEFMVSEDVLIPRQDTEVLVEEVLKFCEDGMKVLDMCTGSGCILISILKYKNDCTGVGADVSAKALDIATRNAFDLIPDKDYRFVNSDLFEKIDEKFDIIVSNPPYIRSDVVDTLEPEVKDHEPRIALDGHDDGLFFYKKIIKDAGQRLNGGGYLFLEIGFDQAEEVCRLLQNEEYREVKVVKDYAGLDRVVYGYRPSF